VVSLDVDSPLCVLEERPWFSEASFLTAMKRPFSAKFGSRPPSGGKIPSSLRRILHCAWAVPLLNPGKRGTPPPPAILTRNPASMGMMSLAIGGGGLAVAHTIQEWFPFPLFRAFCFFKRLL